MNEPKPNIILVFIILCSTGVLILAANTWKSNLKIKQITIEGNRIVGSNEIIQLAHVTSGVFLYKADLTEIQRNVMSHYYIRDAVVERYLPNALHIEIRERIPLAMVNHTETRYIDEDGIILPRSISRRLLDLPMISGISTQTPLTLGSPVTQPDVLETLQLLAVLKAVNRPMYHSISEVLVRNGGDVILYTADGGVPILFGRGEISDKLVRLETFWNTVVLTRGLQKLQYIDLRYHDQIVAKWIPETEITG